MDSDVASLNMYSKFQTTNILKSKNSTQVKHKQMKTLKEKK